MANNSHKTKQTAVDQEFLTFMLDSEEFGVDILSVKEIRVWSQVTEIPDTPSYLKGVINLRGVIIPIVDLRERFNRIAKEYDATTVVIVLRTINQEQNREIMVGIVVDAVSEVYKVPQQHIRPSPDFGNSIDTKFVTGMATIDEKIIILLDSSKLLDANELYSVTSQTRAVS